MRRNPNLEPEITPYGNCPRCREMVLFGSTHCAYCGLELDQEEIFPSVVANFVITQAISSANSIRTLDIGVIFFIGAIIIRRLMDCGLWFDLGTSLFWLAPLWVIVRWYFKHGRWESDDEEYNFAKKEMRAVFLLWAGAHFFNAIVILYAHKAAPLFPSLAPHM